MSDSRARIKAFAVLHALLLAKLRRGIAMPADCPIQMRSKSFSLVNRLTAAHRHIVCDIWPLRVIPVASKTAVLDSNALGVPARYLRTAIRRTKDPAMTIATVPSRTAARLNWPIKSPAAGSPDRRPRWIGTLARRGSH